MAQRLIPIIPPPPPPPSTDLRYIRPWMEQICRSLQSVVDAVRNLDIPDKQPVFKKITGVPDGSAEGQILHWDATNGEWKVSVVGSLSDGDFLKWDGTNKKWIKTDAPTVSTSTITVITDVQYDSGSHKLEKKTRTAGVVAPGAETGWGDISGGQFYEETL